MTLPNLLGVLLIGLKLAHVIDWPWVWVLFPFWAIFTLVFVAGIVGIVIAAVRGKS